MNTKRRLIVSGDDRPLRWPNHAPGARLDYTLDLSAEMKADADTVASAVFVGGGDLVLGPVATTLATVSLWIDGGDPGTDYVVTLSVDTTAGRRFVYAVALWCGAPVLTAAPTLQLIGPPGPAMAVRWPLIDPGGIAQIAPPMSPIGGQTYVLQWLDGVFAWAIAGSTTPTIGGYPTGESGGYLIGEDGQRIILG